VPIVSIPPGFFLPRNGMAGWTVLRRPCRPPGARPGPGTSEPPD